MQRLWRVQFKNKLSARLDLLCHTLATTAVSSVRVCVCELDHRMLYSHNALPLQRARKPCKHQRVRAVDSPTAGCSPGFTDPFMSDSTDTSV